MNGTDGTHTERDRLRKAEYRARKREEAQSGVRPQAPRTSRKADKPSAPEPQPSEKVAASRTRTVSEVRHAVWEPRFLEAFAQTGIVRTAAALAGVGVATVYEARTKEPAFAALFDAAIEQSTQFMEQEAQRRATHGTEKPIYQGGKLVGVIREYSDQLLMFMLKARRPAVYRDNLRMEVSVDVKKEAQKIADETGMPLDAVLAEVERVLAGD
jgi:hypothetical protein